MKKIHGMPMVGHCYKRTELAPNIQKTFVATCDEEIVNYIKSIGGEAVITSSEHKRATSRTAEALEKIEIQLSERFDVIVMVQGDEPMITPETISETVLLFKDSEIDVVNVMSKISTKQEFNDKNNVKVVVDKNNNSLYFSREPIPSQWKGWQNLPRYMQTGIIAFRREALINFNSMEESPLEQIESVDMNRILEMGGKIKMILSKQITIGVDVQNELDKVEKYLRDDPVMPRYLPK